MDEVRTGALGGAVGMGVVTRRVLAAPVVCAAAAEGRVAVREVAGAAVSLGVATCVLDPVGVLAGGEGPAVVWDLTEQLKDMTGAYQALMVKNAELAASLRKQQQETPQEEQERGQDK